MAYAVPHPSTGTVNLPRVYKGMDLPQTAAPAAQPATGRDPKPSEYGPAVPDSQDPVVQKVLDRYKSHGLSVDQMNQWLLGPQAAQLHAEQRQEIVEYLKRQGGS